jgi:hypothetical protein
VALPLVMELSLDFILFLETVFSTQINKVKNTTIFQKSFRPNTISIGNCNDTKG